VRTLQSVTLRLVDPQFSPPAECQQAVAQLLPLLLEKGLGSSVGEVRAIALHSVAKLVKVSRKEALRPHLAPLVLSMLEGLSSLEDTRLNYVEQHAERLGLDQERLERVRVSASRSSPMVRAREPREGGECESGECVCVCVCERERERERERREVGRVRRGRLGSWLHLSPSSPLLSSQADTLEVCAHFADAASLELVVPSLSGLVKRGVGLNTKVREGGDGAPSLTARSLTLLALSCSLPGWHGPLHPQPHDLCFHLGGRASHCHPAAGAHRSDEGGAERGGAQGVRERCCSSLQARQHQASRQDR
jgi:hypothetical protein